MFTPKRTLAVIGILLATLVTFGAWALSSPIGATPDEDFHLASIWCGSGEREGSAVRAQSQITAPFPTRSNNQSATRTTMKRAPRARAKTSKIAAFNWSTPAA
ncbi:hypothetical protein G7066_13215 [Leucobacter coleopterorum]|uniref:Secreted protein n=1 Tax=Leucobacter coleopterorum TaxID=2714933 RepID=A0ABX6JY80_9MICO|nr:hypothetical protein [Leucobacter coleopterorum]QIM19287.1 hypothetical protein G7066_13215 [Leucobacter coleopterorum]